MANELSVRYATGAKLYAFILTQVGQWIWNGTTFVQVAPADWPSCAVPLTEVKGLVGGVLTGTGLYWGDAPSNLPPGTYTVAISIQGGATPASTDVGIGGANNTLVWSGSPPGPVDPITTQITLRFVLRTQSDPNDPASPLVLSDPDGNAVTLAAPAVGMGSPPAYGAVRADTGATVVATGTPMVRQSVGVYTYAFSAAQDDLTYDFWPSYAIDGVAYVDQLRFEPAPAPDVEPIASGFYASQLDLYAEFGQAQVDQWSNISANNRGDAGMPTADVARIQLALGRADAWVNSRMLGSRYVVPLAGAMIRELARSWAARYAGRYLFQARGTASDKKSADFTKYDGLIREALREMNLVRAGTIMTDGATRWPSPTAPVSAMSIRI